MHARPDHRARPSARRWLLLAALATAAAAASAIYILGEGPDGTPPDDAPHERPRAANDHDGSRRERDELRVRMAARSQPTLPLTSSAGPAAAVSGTGDGSDPIPAAAAAQLHQRVTLFADAFAGEHDDPSWSGPAAQRLETSFAAHLPSGAAIDGIACRSSLCRVEVRFPSNQALDDGAADLPLLVPWKSRGFLHPDERDPTRAVLYAAREGAPVP